MLPKKVIKALEKIVGKDCVSLKKEDLLCYAYDATQITHLPDAVVFPHSCEEISKIMRLANEYLFPVVPRGAGSGMSGGAVPIKGGLVLAMSHLNRILEINEEDMWVWVEPGVITKDLKMAVEERGLFYPPDPASQAFSTIGGNIAECAGGPKAVKYGVTKDYVLALEAVLPTGEIIQTGKKTIKGVTGYDLTSLLIGSEGTLAIFTKILLKLLPLPPAKGTVLLAIRDLNALPSVMHQLLRAPNIPTAIEFIDDLCGRCVEEGFRLDLLKGADGWLLIEVDGSKNSVEEVLKFIKEIANKGDIDILKMENEDIWEIRRAISPSLYRLGEKKFNHDIVVPRSRILEMIKKIKSLRRAYNIPVACFGHIGDGNLHVNILFKEGEREQAEIVTAEMMKATLSLGGTISGEHGIGLTKAKFLSWEVRPEAIDLMKRLKRTIDPNNILNPGKIWP